MNKDIPIDQKGEIAAAGSTQAHALGAGTDIGLELISKGGASDWLIDVARSGLISSAQAMICMPDQGAVVGCP